MSKPSQKKYDCPTCDQKKSKLAKTCQPCYYSGLGYKRAYGKHPRYDEEMKSNLRKIVDDFKKGKRKNDLY